MGLISGYFLEDLTMQTQGIYGTEHGLWTLADYSLNSKGSWTNNEVNQLKNLVNQDMSPSMIARQLRRPILSIRMKAIELGLKLPDPSD